MMTDRDALGVNHGQQLRPPQLTPGPPTWLRQSRLWLWTRWRYRQVLAGWSRAVDWVLGARTTLPAPASPSREYEFNAFQGKPYGWFASYRLFRSLRISTQDVMVDIGSGTGRVVLAASLFPFQRVIGVELLEHMHQQAQENLARMRVRPRAQVEFVLMDAQEYRIPEDTSIIFMNNPFRGSTFRHVMDSVFVSVDRVPRRVRLVYANPKEHDYLIETGRCRLVKRFRGLRPTREWARMLATYIYEVEASASCNQGLANSAQTELSTSRDVFPVAPKALSSD
jgi:SAM-dependent methyltransferase